MIKFKCARLIICQVNIKEPTDGTYLIQAALTFSTRSSSKKREDVVHEEEEEEEEEEGMFQFEAKHTTEAVDIKLRIEAPEEGTVEVSNLWGTITIYAPCCIAYYVICEVSIWRYTAH